MTKKSRKKNNINLEIKRNQSCMKHMTDQWAIQTEVNQGGGKITTNRRWEWNVGGQEVKWTEVKRENTQELEMTGAELQQIPTTKGGSWQIRKEGRPRKLGVKSIKKGRLQERRSKNWSNKPQRKRSSEGMNTTTRGSTTHVHNARLFSTAQNRQQGLGSHPHTSRPTATTQIPIFLTSQYECHSRNRWLAKRPPS